MVLQLCGRVCRRLSFEKPVLLNRLFVLSKYELKIKGEDFIVLKYNPTKIAVGEVVAPEGTTTQHTTTR